MIYSLGSSVMRHQQAEVMLVAYVSNSFPKSGGRSFILQTFSLHQLCGVPGCAPGSGPRHVGLGCPFQGHLLTPHLRQASERVSGPTHASSFLSSPFLTLSSFPRREGGGLTPAPSWAPATRGRCGGGRRTGRASV